MKVIEGDMSDQKLFKKRFRLNVRKYAFSNRVIDNWNMLPASCVIVVLLTLSRSISRLNVNRKQ